MKPYLTVFSRLSQYCPVSRALNGTNQIPSNSSCWNADIQMVPHKKMI